MALTKFALKLLAPHLRGARVLCLGYPDLLVTPPEASEILGVAVRKATPFQIAHKALKGVVLADTIDAFNAVGAEAVFVDIEPSRGVEIKVDLNDPLSLADLPGWPELFDLVIDAGTIEHCANVGQALMSAARSVLAGGRVFHSPPLSMCNHGFYNFCPTLLHDFYTQNGWEIEHLSAFHKNSFDRSQVESTKRFVPVSESALYFLARRSIPARPLGWPRQTRYSPP